MIGSFQPFTPSFSYINDMKNPFLFFAIFLFCALVLVIFLKTENQFFPFDPSFSERGKEIALAKDFLEKGNPDSVITLLSSALKKNPGDFLIHFFLASAYFKKNELSLAEYQCEKASKLNPESQKVKELLCDVRFEKAKEKWQKDEKRKALFDFLFVLTNSDKKETTEKIADLTGGRFKIERKTNDLVADFAPRFSPDGKKVAFHSDTSFLLEDYGLKKRLVKKSKIFVMDTQGKEKMCLTSKDSSEKFPSFSKDGKKIAYEKENITPRTDSLVFNYDRDIFVKDLHSGEEERLTRNDVYDALASFSPDNRKILFVSDQYGGICVMDLDTKKVKSLYQCEEKLLPKTSPPLPFYPSFSFDGEKILFDAGFAQRKIYLMDKDGENLKCLSGLENEDFFPSFSPDDERLAFISNRDEADELYLMDSDGTQERRLTFDGMDKKYPCFSPDGKTIAYVAKPVEQKDHYFEIYFLNLEQVISKNELIKRIEKLLEMFS